MSHFTVYSTHLNLNNIKYLNEMYEIINVFQKSTKFKN